MTFLSLRETLPKTLQIDFFPCRRSFEWETRSFQYFSFLFCIYLKTKQGLSSNAKKKWGCPPPKKVFSIALCVFFSSNVIFSTSTACETHNFEYFSFLSRIHLKQTMNYLKMHQKSGVVSPKKKFLYCLVCVLLY